MILACTADVNLFSCDVKRIAAVVGFVICLWHRNEETSSDTVERTEAVVAQSHLTHEHVGVIVRYEGRLFVSNGVDVVTILLMLKSLE